MANPRTVVPVSSATAETNNAANVVAAAKGSRQRLGTYYCGRCRGLKDRELLKEQSNGLLVCRDKCGGER